MTLNLDTPIFQQSCLFLPINTCILYRSYSYLVWERYALVALDGEEGCTKVAQLGQLRWPEIRGEDFMWNRQREDYHKSRIIPATNPWGRNQEKLTNWKHLSELFWLSGGFVRRYRFGQINSLINIFYFSSFFLKSSIVYGSI